MKRLGSKSTEKQPPLWKFERRLIATFDRTVHRDYPNPERIGCPGTEILQKFAASPEKFGLKSILEHLGHCAPCLDELKELRSKMKASGKTSSH